ncbi:hypothetical protein COOONC_25082 [Cooperia oncophora]
MVVEHVGRHLLVEYGVADKKMLKLNELVQLIQPADIQQLTHKNIMTYLNTLFIFQLKHHCQRSEVEKNSSEAFQQPLSLKALDLKGLCRREASAVICLYSYRKVTDGANSSQR